MSIAAKPILAGGLLLGVTVVWVPRLTGFDPLGMLPEELPKSTSIPTSGNVGTDMPTESQGNILDIAANDDLQGLADIVEFLEQRDEAEGMGVAPSVSVSTGAVAPTYVTEVESIEGDGPPPFQQELEGFLARQPLHAIVAGNGLTTATFGFERVTVGDALFDERVSVQAIDLDGVVLETPEGSVRVQLPPSGSLSYTPRSAQRFSDTSSGD